MNVDPRNLPEDFTQKALRRLAKQAGFDFLETIPNPDPAALRCIPAEFARAHGIFPIRFSGSEEDGRLIMAVSDPVNLDLMDTLHYQFKMKFDFIIASPTEIKRAIGVHYPKG